MILQEAFHDLAHGDLTVNRKRVSVRNLGKAASISLQIRCALTCIHHVYVSTNT